MNLKNSLRQEAKTDSRRFAKSIICRIVHGPMLSFCIQNGITPPGVIPNIKNGLDPINNKIFAIPVNQYSTIDKLFSELSSFKPNQNSDLADIESAISKKESFISAIKQCIVFISVSYVKPDNTLAGLPPELWDIQIDSIDINQTIEGTYVPKARITPNREPKIND
jgi:hypothetical protein